MAGRPRASAAVVLEPLEGRWLLSAFIEAEPIGRAETVFMAPLGASESTVSGTDQGNCNGGGYSWSYRYHIDMIPEDTVQVTLRIRLVGTYDADDMQRWEQGIEDLWSHQFALVDLGMPMPVMMDCIFVSSGADQTVTVYAGAGRSTMTTWYTSDSGRVAAHEAGHMIGLYDEYAGGGTHPRDPIYDSTSIMGSLSGTVYARHYEGVESWLEDRTGRDLLLIEIAGAPALLSLQADPDTTDLGQGVTLTAQPGGVDPDAVVRVAFYRDANGDGVLTTAADTFLAADTDGQDGWTHEVDSSRLPAGTSTLLARARTADGQWSPAASANVQVQASGPDLTLAIRPGLAFPASGTQGQWLSVPLEVSNLGTDRAVGSVAVDVYASADTTLDADDMRLTHETRAIYLDAATDAPLDVAVQLPADIEPGEYHILAVVNADGALPEASLANNQAVTAEVYGFDPDQPLQFEPPSQGWLIQGEDYRLAWTGGTRQTMLDVWTIGPAGWHLEQAGIQATDGSYTWRHQAGPRGGYGLVVWTRDAAGTSNGRLGGAVWVEVLPAGSAPGVPPAPPAEPEKAATARLADWSENERRGEAALGPISGGQGIGPGISTQPVEHAGAATAHRARLASEPDAPPVWPGHGGLAGVSLATALLDQDVLIRRAAPGQD